MGRLVGGGWVGGLLDWQGIVCRHAAGLADPWLGRQLGGYLGGPLSRQLYGQLGR